MTQDAKNSHEAIDLTDLEEDRKRPSVEEQVCKRKKARGGPTHDDESLIQSGVKVTLHCANHTTVFTASVWMILLDVLKENERQTGCKCTRIEAYLSNAKEPEADGKLELSTTIETLSQKAKGECIELTGISIAEIWDGTQYRETVLPAIDFLRRFFSNSASHQATAYIEQAEPFMSFYVPQNARFDEWRIGVFAAKRGGEEEMATTQRGGAVFFVEYSPQDELRLKAALATDCCVRAVQSCQTYINRPSGLDFKLTLCLDFGSLVLLLYGSAPDGTVQRIGRMPLSSVVYTEELAEVQRLARWTVFQHPSAKPIANDQLVPACKLGFCQTPSNVELAIMHDIGHTAGRLIF